MNKAAWHVAVVLALGGLAGCVKPAPPPPVVMPPPASAAPPPQIGAAPPASTAPTEADQHFVEGALAAGAREVALGQVARAKARHPEIRAFAKRLVSDHAITDRRLDALARAHGIVPQGGGVDRQAIQARLIASDAALDREYIRGQVRRQRALVDLFNDEARHGTVPALKHFAVEALPLLHRHLHRAEALAQTFGG